MKSIRWLWKNPVLVKEFRTRMRGNRAFVIVTAHLLFLSLVVGLAYALFTSSLNSLEERRAFGKAVFGLVIGIEMIMISFVAPALTSGSISLERERQTYDLLRVTLLSARSLITGKYASGLLFIFLLVFTAAPLQSPAFMFGGVQAEEILIGILILTVTAIAFCAVGTFISSLLKRTLFSTVLSYAFAIFVVFGIPIIALTFLLLLNATVLNSRIPELSQGMQTFLILIAWLVISLTPLATIIAAEIILIDQQSIFLVEIPTLNGEAELLLISPWILYTLIYLLLSVLLLLASVNLVKRVDK